MVKGIKNFDTGRPILRGLVPLTRLLKEVHVTMPDRAYLTLEHDNDCWRIVRVLTDTVDDGISLVGTERMPNALPLKAALNSMLPPEERVRFRCQVELRRKSSNRWFFREPVVISEGYPLRREAVHA